MRTLLIDADVVAYKLASVLESTWVENGFIQCRYVDEGLMKDTIDIYLEELMVDLHGDEIVIAMSCPTGRYFRHDIYPDYKGNRKGTTKPIALKYAKEYLGEAYNSYVRPNLEADDIIGILLTHPKLIKGEKVSVSVDKDFLGIPGLHANMDTREIEEVDEDTADWWFMMQTLLGDTVDNYPGCKGIGPKSAPKVLEDHVGSLPDMWDAVVAAFEKKGFDYDHALLQARLARILRASDYNFKKKEVVLWTP